MRELGDQDIGALLGAQSVIKEFVVLVGRRLRAVRLAHLLWIAAVEHALVILGPGNAGKFDLLQHLWVVSTCLTPSKS